MGGGGDCSIDVEKVKLKSPLKQIVVDDSPTILHDIIVKDRSKFIEHVVSNSRTND